jgi:hypothetical protein
MYIFTTTLVNQYARINTTPGLALNFSSLNPKGLIPSYASTRFQRVNIHSQ